MLSRVAENLYWASRYLERAEHNARLIDVNLNLALDQSPRSQDRRWERLLISQNLAVNPGESYDAYATARQLTFDLANPSSIINCIANARENARQVRGQLSSEMWEQINRFYLTVNQTDLDQIWQRQPYEFFRSIKEGIHLFQGITDSTMNHGEGWHFIQVGRYLERAFATAVLVDTHYQAYAAGQFRAGVETSDYLEWVGLLKSCTAFEAFCKVYTANLQPVDIAEFLLLNPEFPHSVRFGVDMVRNALQTIAGHTGQRASGRINRLAGRLQATLSFSQMDEVIATDLHRFLADIQGQCRDMHASIYDTYFNYAIEQALAA